MNNKKILYITPVYQGNKLVSNFKIKSESLDIFYGSLTKDNSELANDLQLIKTVF